MTVRATRCPKGHEYTEANTCASPAGVRSCRECHRLRQQRYRDRQQSGERAPLVVYNAPRTHCPHGHEYTEANVYVSGRGIRRCRTCRAASKVRYRQKRAARLALA